MPRFRIEFAKRDQVRFLSHLDMVKAFERAIRRAEIPIAFSEGFNPHPKMNFASALAVGVVSENEYMDIDLKEDIESPQVSARLSKAMPPGLDIKNAWRIPEKAPSLMAEVNRALYEIKAPLHAPVEAGRLQSSIDNLLDNQEITITKRTKKGLQQKNIRPGIIEVAGEITPAGSVEFKIMTAMSNDGSVRPEEVVAALISLTGLPVDAEAMYIKRLALFIEKEGRRMSPAETVGGD